jgi:uncharacterized protein (DUF1499 family)
MAVSRLPSRLAVPALAAALLAGAALASSGFGYRWGVWGLSTAFAIMRSVVFAGGAAAVLAAVALVVALAHRRWVMAAVAGLALVAGAVTVAVPVGFSRNAAAVPPIHDIATDTTAPPPFVALRHARMAAPNGADYGGAVIAAQQARAYPDLRPLRFSAPADRVFNAVVTAARQSGWQVAAAVAGEGRLEATVTTPWFGFRDDVVVRVVPDGNGTTVDVRSASRVGRSDLGVNARRIRVFADAVRRAVQQDAR